MFRRLDYPLWRQTAHNPVLMLRQVSPEMLALAAQDERFLGDLRRRDRGARRARARARHLVAAPVPRQPRARSPTSPPSSRCTSRCRSTPAASACSPAITARKRATSASRSSASASCIRRATSTRRVSPEGWQQEVYERLNWADAPVEPAMHPDGKPCVVAVPLGNRSVLVSVWRVRLGRVKLYLLDTDLEENAPWDRELSARLYGGDRETRIQQEIILGIGGVRALQALGVAAGGLAPQRRPRRVRRAAADPRPDRAAASRSTRRSQDVRRTTMFTTHTPVPAGHDAFPFNLVETHLAGAGARSATYRDAFLALGHYDNGSGPQFNMTALALRTAGARQRRQPAARRRSRARCGRRSGRACPTTSVRSARSPTASTCRPGSRPSWPALFDDHLGGDWRERHDDPALWDADPATFPTRSCGRRATRCGSTCSRSSASARGSAGRTSRSAPPRVVAAGTLLDPNALTIGFARRFTGYKRPELIFHNPDRLMRILNARAPSGADRLRRQGASRRRDRQAPPAAGLPPRHRSDVRRPHRLRRRLRPARRALPGAGLRRLAEQPAQAARGERHQRHEGVDQRRAAPAASATAGGRRASTGKNGWLIDGQAPPTRSGRGRRRRRRRALPPARDARSCRRSTTATRTASRGAGCRSSGKRSSRSRRASARAGWSRSTRRRCTAPAHQRQLTSSR